MGPGYKSTSYCIELHRAVFAGIKSHLSAYGSKLEGWPTMGLLQCIQTWWLGIISGGAFLHAAEGNWKFFVLTMILSTLVSGWKYNITVLKTWKRFLYLQQDNIPGFQPLLIFVWKSHIGWNPGEKRGPGELVNIKGSLHLSQEQFSLKSRKMKKDGKNLYGWARTSSLNWDIKDRKIEIGWVDTERA